VSPSTLGSHAVVGRALRDGRPCPVRAGAAPRGAVVREHSTQEGPRRQNGQGGSRARDHKRRAPSAPGSCLGVRVLRGPFGSLRQGRRRGGAGRPGHGVRSGQLPCVPGRFGFGPLRGRRVTELHVRPYPHRIEVLRGGRLRRTCVAVGVGRTLSTGARGGAVRCPGRSALGADGAVVFTHAGSLSMANPEFRQMFYTESPRVREPTEPGPRPPTPGSALGGFRSVPAVRFPCSITPSASRTTARTDGPTRQEAP